MLGDYLQQDIYNLIKSISSDKHVNPDEEILLLTKEKEIQYQELLERELSNQQNKTIISTIIAAFILSVVALILLYRVNVNKSISNTILVEQQQENKKKQSKSIENRNKELVSLNEEKHNLIHVLAHDLRTPINQISGLVNLHTLQHKELSNEDEVIFDTILASIDRLNKMISKILNVEAIESQVPNMKMERINISELLKKVTDVFTVVAEEKSIRIETNYQDGILAITDEVYLRQILNNLCSNAIKFSYPGSIVNLSVTQNQKEFCIKIADQGPGFTQQDKAKLFGKFQRLSAKPTAGESSTGLGLSIVKKYVDLLNGVITCDSEMGKGSVFRVSFPLA